MIDENTVIFGIVLFLVFIWRLARTRQIYLLSVGVESGDSEPIPFSPQDFRSFVNQALFGHRSCYLSGDLCLGSLLLACSPSRSISLLSSGLLLF